MVTINVRFIGSFREAAEIESQNYEIERNMILRNFFQHLINEFKDNELKNRFRKVFENQANDFLVLINGKELSTCGGLDSELKDGDEVTLIPISHGG
ncbi:MoaD/ThiS family protein [[Eubacterium] cellulosolvens]